MTDKELCGHLLKNMSKTDCKLHTINTTNHKINNIPTFPALCVCVISLCIFQLFKAISFNLHEQDPHNMTVWLLASNFSLQDLKLTTLWVWAHCSGIILLYYWLMYTHITGLRRHWPGLKIRSLKECPMIGTTPFTSINWGDTNFAIYICVQFFDI